MNCIGLALKGVYKASHICSIHRPSNQWLCDWKKENDLLFWSVLKYWFTLSSAAAIAADCILLKISWMHISAMWRQSVNQDCFFAKNKTFGFDWKTIMNNGVLSSVQTGACTVRWLTFTHPLKRRNPWGSSKGELEQGEQSSNSMVYWRFKEISTNLSVDRKLHNPSLTLQICKATVTINLILLSRLSNYGHY